MLTTPTTLKKVGDPAFSESQTDTIEFLSWQAAFQVIDRFQFNSHENGIPPSDILPVSETAYRRVAVSGGSRPLQWVEWLARGFGPVVRLDLDPAAAIGDGTVPTRIWVSHAPDFLGPPPFPPPFPGGLFYPLNITHKRLYTVSPGTGAGDINITMDLPFGIVRCDADPDAGNVFVRYSLPVATTGTGSALNIGNYNLFVNGSPLDLTGAAAEMLDPQTVEIEGLSGLTPGGTLKVVARNVQTADFAKTIEDPGGTTTDDPNDPKVCETKIHVVPFRIDFCFATDDPRRAVVIAFNRPVDLATALNKANYALESPPGTAKDLTPPSVVIEIWDDGRHR